MITDHTFKPALTPMQMIRLGVFDGTYWSKEDWYKGMPSNGFKFLSEEPSPQNNLFRVSSGQSLEHWQAKGWILPSDPKGWFQWYCRYHLGRRCGDDQKQIARWRAFYRHSRQVAINGDQNLDKRTVQRQALLHWAYDPVPDIQLDGVNTFDKLKLLIG